MPSHLPHPNHHYHQYHYMASIKTLAAREGTAEGKLALPEALKKVLVGDLLDHRGKQCHTHPSAGTKVASPKSS